MRFVAAQFDALLTDDLWIRNAAHANAMAQRLAHALATLPAARLLAPVQANGVFVDLPRPAIDALHGNGWRFYTFIGDTGVRLMCSWDTPAEAVDRLVDDLRTALATDPAAMR
jgi:threonine aldolase